MDLNINELKKIIAGNAEVSPEDAEKAKAKVRQGIAALIEIRREESGGEFAAFMIVAGENTPIVSFVSFDENGEPMNALTPEPWSEVMTEAIRSDLQPHEVVMMDTVMKMPAFKGLISDATEDRGKEANEYLSKNLDDSQAVMCLISETSLTDVDFIKVTTDDNGNFVDQVGKIDFM